MYDFDIKLDYNNMQTLLIDANHLLSRTFHVPSFQNLKATVDGQTVLTGATYGFLNSLKSIVDSHSKDILIVVWDGGGKGFRSEIYPQYKANRTPRTEEFIFQLELTRKCLQLMGVRQAQIRGVEADDVIGTLTRRARSKGYKVLIVSGDKDFNQLVSNNVNVLNPRAEDDNSDRLMTPDKVKEKYGILPNQFIDWLALNGDSTDNIEGIDGIGKKTSTELIVCNGGIESIVNTDVHYKFAKDGSKKPVSKNLQEKINLAKDALKLNRQLVEIKTDCVVDVERDEPDFHGLKNIFKKYEFNTFLKNFNEFVVSFS